MENAGRLAAGERTLSTLDELDHSKILGKIDKGSPWETMAEIQARLHEATEKEWRRRQGRGRQGSGAGDRVLSRQKDAI